MLKRNITYEDFNGDTVTEEFYFNLSRMEVVELNFEFEEGFEAFIAKIMNNKDYKALIAEFKRIVLGSYGQKSEDGKSFIKTPEIQEAFSHSAAYEQLLMELTTSETAVKEFILGALPKSMVKEVEQITRAPVQDKPTGPPKPPSPPVSLR